MSNVPEVATTASDSRSDTKSANLTEEKVQSLDGYLEEHGPLESRLLRKIDWRIVPIMMACYTIQFLDKILLNFAAVMGLNKDTKLVGNQFSWLGSAYSIAFVLSQYPSGLLMQKFPVDRLLGIMIVCWGISVATTAACNDFTSLMVVRVLLGLFEGSVAPGLIIITSEWYTKEEATPRMGFWYCGLGVGQIVGSFLSYGFQFVTTGFHGWRIMFLVMGIVTVLIGVWTWLGLPRSPAYASWLTVEEKEFLIQRNKKNQTGNIEDHKIQWYQIREFFVDPAAWLVTAIALMGAISSGFVSFYSSTVIKNIGFNSKQSALLSAPSGVISIAAVLAAAIAVGKGQPRGVCIALALTPATLGAALLTGLSSKNKGGLLAGVYLVNFVMPTVNLCYSWAGANFGGYTKRICINAAIMVAFGLGNIIGPQTFQAKDAPVYMPAKITVLVADGTGALLAIGATVLYTLRNNQRNKASKDTSDLKVLDEVHDKNMTDFENRNFRYQY